MKNTNLIFWLALIGSISFLAPVMTLFYLHRGITLQQIFFLLLVIVVTMFFLEIPTGIFGDKYGKKKSIVAGYFLMMVSSILLIFAHSFWLFVLCSFIFAAGYTFISGSDEALIYESLKSEGKVKEMKKYMSKVNAADYIPLIITAPIGAIVAKNLAEKEFMIILIASAIISFVVFLMSMMLKEMETEEDRKKNKKKNDAFHLFISSIKDIKNSPILVRLFINKTLVLIICSHVFGNLWQPYLMVSKVPVILFGFLISVCAIFIVYVNMNIEKLEKYVSSKFILYLTAVLPFIMLLLGAFLRNFFFAIIFYFILKLSLEIRNPIFSHYVNQHIKSHNRATVLSSLSMVDSFFDVVIFLTVGFATNAGLSMAFLISAFILLIALTFFKIDDEHVVETKLKKRTKLKY